MLDPMYIIDEEHPYRSSPQFSLMFWNLGKWCRTRFNQCPLPERLQKFAPNIDYNLDSNHEKIGDNKPQFNNATFSPTSSRTLGHISLCLFEMG